MILCDLGNVLVNFDHRIAVRRILPFTDKPFEEIYRFFFDSPLTKDYEEGRISSREFYSRMRRALMLRGLTYERFARIWSEIFFPNTAMVRLLRRLRRRHVRLHLISNINKLHYDYIVRRFPGSIGVFDRLHLSYKIGARKPSAKIYRHALAGVAKRAVLYTDDRADLIKQARAMGIPSIRFTGAEDFAKHLKALKVLA